MMDDVRNWPYKIDEMLAAAIRRGRLADNDPRSISEINRIQEIRSQLLAALAQSNTEPHREPDPTQVICPNCTHQFTAISVADQERLRAQSDAEPARDVFMEVLASLVAAVSLLKSGGKKAAPSDKMFDQMILDYERAIEHGRAALAQSNAGPVAPIEADPLDPTREYIPLPAQWEIQTKGKGSSYRLLDRKTGKRMTIMCADTYREHDFVTRMAKEIHAAVSTTPPRPDASAGMSWSGFNIYGDKKSVDAVRDALHAKDRCEALDKMIGEKQLVRPDASAGLIEAAEITREWAGATSSLVEAHLLDALARELRARAADRSGK